MKNAAINFVGTFSWEKPIEEEMLSWLQHMTSNMEHIAAVHSSKQIRRESECMALAYRTAGEHLLEEIRLRQKREKTKEQS